jgi:hypothetical protein
MMPLTGAVQRQLRVAHRRGGGEHLRMVRDGGAVDLCDRLVELLACRGDVCAAGGDGITRVRELLGGNGAIRDESAAALQIVIRGALCLFTLVDQRAQLLALREQPAHLPDGARQVGLCIGDRNFRIGGIELQQRLSGAHALGVVDLQRQHGARDLARHLHHIAVHVRIVGRLVEPAVEEPVGAVDDCAQHDDGAKGPEPDVPHSAGCSRGLRIGCHGCWGVHGLARVRRSEEFAGMCASAATPDARGSKLPPTARSTVTRDTAWLVKMSTMDCRAAST